MERPPVNPYLILTASIVAVSTASILIRLSTSPPMIIAAYRLLFATLMLTPLYIVEGGHRSLMALGPRRLLTLIAVGLILAVHFASWITSLSYTTVASSVIFVHMDPIIVALLSHLLLGERLSVKRFIGVLIAFLGAIIIGWGDLGIGNLYGDLLSLLGAFALALYLVAGRSLRRSLSLLEYVTPLYATSAALLILGCLIMNIRLYPYPVREYLLFLLIAFIPMILGHTLFNWALRYVEAPVVSVSLLGEPIGASLLALIILGELPPATTILGGAITLLGIYITSSGE
ncbi:MAG TPA: DMT family transporter [Candidatus Bathyarchaeota archaeon]|nr:DMT family transporter [Candidatus Bathyarchaeota archaeon]